MARIKLKLRHICLVEKQRRTPSGKLAGNAKKGTVSREQENFHRCKIVDIWAMARSRDSRHNDAGAVQQSNATRSHRRHSLG